MPIVELKQVSYAYDGPLVIDGLSFTVKEGEFLGVIGPNGSGKTTLLRLLSKVLQPGKGEVLLSGQNLRRFSQRQVARVVAVVPQETSVYFPFTAREVVLMGRSPHLGPFAIEGPRDLEACEEAMALTDTLHLADRILVELSGGEKRRVIIARALAQRPRILLLDECATFLDIRHKLEIFEIVKRLNEQQGLTVISVEHDLNMASRYAKRLLLLQQGRLFALGSPQEVLTVQNIQQVFKAIVSISKEERTGAPQIFPVGLS
jgi:iron complex transport system ATP-binding protein